jgi:signal transduction histidine kinase/CheY-like chemotaxis protein
MQPLHKLSFEGDPDVVHVRRVVRRLAQLLGFDQRDEVKITAAVSELTRAAGTAAGGTIELGFFVAADDRGGASLVIDATGPGLTPAARKRGSSSAENLVAAEKLLERLPGTTTAPAGLRFGKRLPERVLPLSGERRAAIRAELARIDSARTDPSREELLQQSRELAETLLDLEERKQQLTTLNAELSDTNRGVMALYAELDERATHLRRADEVKTQFFSHMSHEFRTPLNSILALANILLDESDGPLASEQRRQVSLIRDGVADLLDLVSDLLDLSKMEAGKTDIHVGEVAVGALFGALRAMIRPLLGASAVALEFEAAAELPPLVTDETKIAQILRNFLSNAVKFTERGTITVSARRVPAGERVGGAPLERDGALFAVADTGIGIAAEHQAAIFEEYRQVDSRLQRKSRGTGLGLPLCRRLAGLLGGRVWVESALGRGATFYLLVPLVHETAPAAGLTAPDARPRLLIVDERVERRAALGATFRDSAFLPIEAAAAEITPASLAALQPAIALLGTVDTPPAALDALRAAAVPCVLAANADVTAEGGRAELVAETYRTALRSKLHVMLVLDDDEAYRTILTKHLAPFCEAVHATGSWREALAEIRRGTVNCLVLDLIMPELDGFAVLEKLRDDAAAAELPVVVCSSKSLSRDEELRLRRMRAPFLAKDKLAAALVARALVDARRLATAFTQPLTGSAA